MIVRVPQHTTKQTPQSDEAVVTILHTYFRFREVVSNKGSVSNLIWPDSSIERTSKEFPEKASWTSRWATLPSTNDTTQWAIQTYLLVNQRTVPHAKFARQLTWSGRLSRLHPAVRGRKHNENGGFGKSSSRSSHQHMDRMLQSPSCTRCLRSMVISPRTCLVSRVIGNVWDVDVTGRGKHVGGSRLRSVDGADAAMLIPRYRRLRGRCWTGVAEWYPDNARSEVLEVELVVPWRVEVSAPGEVRA